MMKFNQNKILGVLAIAVSVSACNPNISNDITEDAEMLSRGDADFSVFVAVGDSLTAGYSDNALYREGQEASVPNIMAQQFAKVGGGTFTQPLMPTGGTGSLTLTPVGDLGRSDRLVLAPTGNPDSPVGPSAIMPAQSTSIDVPVGLGGYNNIGVPGAKMYHAVAAGYGNPAGLPTAANPYFARFASSGTASMLGDAAALSPTFFLYWLGNNDVFGYASGGATGTDRTGDPDVANYDSEDITDPGFFSLPGVGYAAQVATLTAGGAKGVLVNIPRIESAAYFTTVPYNAIPLDAATADQLTAQVTAGYDLALDGAVAGSLIDAAEAERRRVSFSEGQNPVLIIDETLTDLTAVFAGPLAPLVGLAQARPATPDDFILLPTLAKLDGEETVPGNPLSVWGVTLPLLDEDVLTASEAVPVETARQAYNAVIEATANSSENLLMFDAAAAFAVGNVEGFDYGNGSVYTEFATGGFFSLDGFHLSQRGYAVVANLMIDLINEGFNANVPKADPGEYPTAFYQ